MKGVITKIMWGEEYWRISSTGNYDFSVATKNSGRLLMKDGWKLLSEVKVGDILFNAYTDGEMPEFKGEVR